MPDFVCNTSPLQYLHQMGKLDLIPALATEVYVPPAVADEISRGIALGLDLPDVASLPWMRVRSPHTTATHPWQAKLGAGESQVLQLALEMPGAFVLIDDRVARRRTASLKVPLKGTIGLLIDAKHRGLLPEIRPLLDQLDTLGFRLSPQTRVAALRLAGEATA